MHNLLPDLLPRLEAHRLDTIDAGAQAFYPFYDGYSLANLPASILHWLGAPQFAGIPLVPEILGLFPHTFQHVILLVIDGMGLNTLLNTLDMASRDPTYAAWEELARDGALAPMTSISPSTTAAALTTLWTGRTPAEHGIVGYEVYLKEYGMIANMILHSPASFLGDVGSLRRAGFNPETFLPVPMLGLHLANSGIKAFAFQHQSIARSGLSTMLLSGVEVVPYRSLGDLWVTLDALKRSYEGDRTYTYIYWGDLDEHSHRFGPDDPRVALEFAGFSQRLTYFVSEQRRRSRGDTLLIITADHGHIYTPKRAGYEIRNHPQLLDCLVMLPSGEARLPFVYLRPGREARFLDYLESSWPGQFLAIPSEQAISAGLFGSSGVYQRLPERVGDYVIVPQNDAYWWFADRDNPLLGRHGGLSRTEMLVPFFAAVI